LVLLLFPGAGIISFHFISGPRGEGFWMLVHVFANCGEELFPRQSKNHVFLVSELVPIDVAHVIGPPTGKPRPYSLTRACHHVAAKLAERSGNLGQIMIAFEEILESAVADHTAGDPRHQDRTLLRRKTFDAMLVGFHSQVVKDLSDVSLPLHGHKPASTRACRLFLYSTTRGTILEGNSDGGVTLQELDNQDASVARRKVNFAGATFVLAARIRAGSFTPSSRGMLQRARAGGSLLVVR
jgi:hypothetical protein